MAKCRVDWGPAADDADVKLFRVSNTSHNSLLVLAVDEKEAMSMAQSANHVYGTQTIHALNYDRMCSPATAWDMRGKEHLARLIDQAVKDRRRITVEFDGDAVWLGNDHVSITDKK